MKSEIFIVPLHKNRLNAFWYHGMGNVARFIKGNREIVVSTCGKIRVKFTKGQHFTKNAQAVDVALDNNLYDKDLPKIDFSENNWFDYIYRKLPLNDWEEIDGDEQFDYQTAINKAKEYIKDNKFWKQF
jgi:hypothetical protein